MLIGRAHNLEYVTMSMSEEIEADCLLISLQNSSVALLVLPAALIWDVSDNDCKLACFLKLIKVLNQELDLIVWIILLGINVQVLKVTAFSVEGNDSCVEVFDISCVVSPLCKVTLLIRRNPEIQ